MTPKEKAQNLFDQFYNHCFNAESHKDDNIDAAKQCALISVDEIRCCISTALYLEESYKVDKYWQEVRQEIEKL